MSETVPARRRPRLHHSPWQLEGQPEKELMLEVSGSLNHIMHIGSNSNFQTRIHKHSQSGILELESCTFNLQQHSIQEHLCCHDTHDVPIPPTSLSAWSTSEAHLQHKDITLQRKNNTDQVTLLLHGLPLVLPWYCQAEILDYWQAEQLRGGHKGCPIFGHCTHHNLPDHVCKMILEPTNNMNIANSWH